jgi:hypothetical protein
MKMDEDEAEKTGSALRCLDPNELEPLLGWVNKNDAFFFIVFMAWERWEELVLRLSGICLGNWEGSGAVSQIMSWDPIGTRDPPHAQSAVRETSRGTKPLRMREGSSFWRISICPCTWNLLLAPCAWPKCA